ncbi:Mu-like prophage major head subunit gpT family protein [Undibacterium sp. Di27W]|uniref:Mu-like prophage major head subunit gpT family protein n=1 Tax=Undibacterium sp. Di27W TaxID=3413036 RepID=UPI003BF3783D
MAIVTPPLLKALFTGFLNTFQGALQSAPTQYEKIATVVPSTSASNTYGWLGQFPDLQEWIGERQLKDMAAYGYAITNKLYEGSVSVKRTDIEDDNVGVYTPLFQEMGLSAARYPDKHSFGILKVGQSTLCFDGQNFFDIDHPVYPNTDGTGTPQNVSNLLTPGSGAVAPWYLLDTSRAVKPIIFQKRSSPELTAMQSNEDESVFMKDIYRYGVRARSNVGFGFWQMAVCSTKPLTKASFEEAYDLMRGFKGDGGIPLNITPTILVCPTVHRSAANEVIKVARMANGADNPNYNLVEVLDSAWVNA